MTQASKVCGISVGEGEPDFPKAVNKKARAASIGQETGCRELTVTHDFEVVTESSFLSNESSTISERALGDA